MYLTCYLNDPVQSVRITRVPQMCFARSFAVYIIFAEVLHVPRALEYALIRIKDFRAVSIFTKALTRQGVFVSTNNSVLSFQRFTIVIFIFFFFIFYFKNRLCFLPLNHTHVRICRKRVIRNIFYTVKKSYYRTKLYLFIVVPTHGVQRVYIRPYYLCRGI